MKLTLDELIQVEWLVMAHLLDIDSGQDDLLTPNEQALICRAYIHERNQRSELSRQHLREQQQLGALHKKLLGQKWQDLKFLFPWLPSGEEYVTDETLTAAVDQLISEQQKW